ncbi:hypothetical protein PENTCL1PPCAC_14534, partial [Pristionchus entomophagus]
YQIYSYSTTVTSCVFNGLLIYALLVTKAQHVGPYRWLLMSFAIIDICISLVHTILMPAMHMTEFGVICWSYRFIDQSTDFGFLCMMVWIFLFYQTFALLAFHYVYRFVHFCDPQWLAFMKQNPWRNWISIAVVADIVYIGL